jgi:hypothetical protein
MKEPGHYRQLEDQLTFLALEGQGITNLLRDGSKALREFQYPASHADAVFVLLSLGVVRLLRLTVDLAESHDTGVWPSRQFPASGPRIPELDSYVRGRMRAIASDREQYGDVEDIDLALRRLDSDGIWSMLCHGFDHYGCGGDQHELDWLPQTPRMSSPHTFWALNEDEVFEKYPRLLVQFESAEPGDRENARWRTNEAIRSTVRTWWDAMYLFWASGALGQTAVRSATTSAPTVPSRAKLR